MAWIVIGVGAVLFFALLMLVFSRAEKRRKTHRLRVGRERGRYASDRTILSSTGMIGLYGPDGPGGSSGGMAAMGGGGDAGGGGDGGGCD